MSNTGNYGSPRRVLKYAVPSEDVLGGMDRKAEGLSDTRRYRVCPTTRRDARPVRRSRDMVFQQSPKAAPRSPDASGNFVSSGNSCVDLVHHRLRNRAVHSFRNSQVVVQAVQFQLCCEGPCHVCRQAACAGAALHLGQQVSRDGYRLLLCQCM